MLALAFTTIGVTGRTEVSGREVPDPKCTSGIVILPLGIVSWKDGSVRTGDPDDVKLYTRRAVTHPLGMVNGVGDV